MKKFLIGLAFTVILAISLSSCRSTKPPCPAYSSTTHTTIVENIAR